MMKVLLDAAGIAVFGSFPLVQSLQLSVFFICDVSSPALLLSVRHQFVVLCFQVREVQIRRFRSAHSFFSSSRFATKFSASSGLGSLPIRSEPQEQQIFGVTT